MARSSAIFSSWRIFISSNIALDAPCGAFAVDASHYSVRPSAADSEECRSRSPAMSAAANTAAHESINMER